MGRAVAGGLKVMDRVGDGRCLFFMATRSEPGEAPLPMARLHELNTGPLGWVSDIYWVEASFIEELRPAGAG